MLKFDDLSSKLESKESALRDMEKQMREMREKNELSMKTAASEHELTLADLRGTLSRSLLSFAIAFGKFIKLFCFCLLFLRRDQRAAITPRGQHFVKKSGKIFVLVIYCYERLKINCICAFVFVMNTEFGDESKTSNVQGRNTQVARKSEMPKR